MTTGDSQLIALLDLSPIERHALSSTSLSSTDQRRQAFACYLSMREKIGNDYLPLLNSAVPYINDHTRLHLRRVLQHIEALLERHFPQPSHQAADIPSDRVISWADTLVLINALVWHDMGNMYGREGHAAIVKDCFGAVSGSIYDEFMRNHILRVAEAHSGTGSIERVIPNSHATASYRGEDVHPQFLAATLRFADELDEDHRRISPSEWRSMTRDGKPLVPPSSHRFWYFSERNLSITVRNEAGARTDFAPRVEIVSHIPRTFFKTPFVVRVDKKNKPTKTRFAITEYFRRIFKIENERVYCNKFLQSSYYHPGVSAIRVRLEMHETSQTPGPDDLCVFDLSDREPRTRSGQGPIKRATRIHS